jgi:hypothetical protein
MANPRAIIERTDAGDYRVRIVQRDTEDRIVGESESLVEAVTEAGNVGVESITVLTQGIEPGFAGYPYSAGYAIPGRHARFATADEAINYARECKRANPSAKVSAHRGLPDGGVHYLDINNGAEFPRGERHRF